MTMVNCRTWRRGGVLGDDNRGQGRVHARREELRETAARPGGGRARVRGAERHAAWVGKNGAPSSCCCSRRVAGESTRTANRRRLDGEAPVERVLVAGGRADGAGSKEGRRRAATSAWRREKLGAATGRRGRSREEAPAAGRGRRGAERWMSRRARGAGLGVCVREREGGRTGL
jgi:hypothetical protein